MPITSVVAFRATGGAVPFLDWFKGLPEKAQNQCRARLELLKSSGHELRRPACENLGDGIYELRAKANGVNYRMLYFFDGQRAIIVSHGFMKQQAQVAEAEIERAKANRAIYQKDPKAHTHTEKEDA
jgi:phage-related protein